MNERLLRAGGGEAIGSKGTELTLLVRWIFLGGVSLECYLYNIVRMHIPSPANHNLAAFLFRLHVNERPLEIRLQWLVVV